MSMCSLQGQSCGISDSAKQPPKQLPYCVAAKGTAPNSKPPTKSAPISSQRIFINSPTNLPASGFIITGFISKNQREVRPLARVNASSEPPSRNARSRTRSTRRAQRGSSRSAGGTDMNLPSV